MGTLTYSYSITRHDLEAFQEGNLDAIDIDIADTFPLANISDITLSVVKLGSSVFIRKKKSEGGIIASQLEGGVWNMTIPIQPSDTIGNPGNHIYEIDFIGLQGMPIATIKGIFIIEKQYNES